VATYQWQINNGNYGTNAPTFTTNTLKNGDKVTCTVTATDACAVPVASDAVIMEVLQPPDIDIPNAFTPNGDGINDTWQITQLTFYTDCVVKIFNRSGMLLYLSKGYANAWDGTFNGKKLPAGTYYFIIDTHLTGNGRRSGYVSILQ
jgi:gliding motility-associated-like protein